MLWGIFEVDALCFAYYLNKAGVFEFNPYEGKTYRELYSDTDAAPNITMSEVVKDNPGFAPVYDSSFPGRNPNINGYACVTGFFNQDYLDDEAYKNNYEYFYHEGVDFRAANNTPVVSLIHAEVIAFGWMFNVQGKPSGYGKSVWLKNSGKKGVYLLAHLSRFVNNIRIGMQVFPGNIIAYTGSSGYGLLEHWAPHLHLSYFDLAMELDKIYLITEYDNIKCATAYHYMYSKISNPFRHDDRNHKGSKRK